DWVIDLGPEGGERGGEVVCCGPPERVARCPQSYTGKYLRKVLEKHRQWGEVAAVSPKKLRSHASESLDSALS
ncbi:MAG: hypothetical protein HY647_04165, partial [Acidobacteria bacterium]|nr:hypothetical protein [Acidobacteriota bacterium]